MDFCNSLSLRKPGLWSRDWSPTPPKAAPIEPSGDVRATRVAADLVAGRVGLNIWSYPGLLEQTAADVVGPPRQADPEGDSVLGAAGRGSV
jgi:hypothetical protein